MGASDNEIQKSNKIASFLISFANIEEFANYFYSISNDRGKLSDIFTSFLNNQKRLKLIINEFKKLLGENFNYKNDNLLEFNLDTLNKELNNKKENNLNWLDEFNQKIRILPVNNFFKITWKTMILSYSIYFF